MRIRTKLRNAVALGAVAFGAYAAYAWSFRQRFENLDPETPDAPGTFVDVDGVRLHYVEAGRRDSGRQPALLLHGWNGSTFTYRYTIPELARERHVIALDLMGFGYSARPREHDYSIVAQVRLIRGFLDALRITSADVVGHSMGGAIAMHLAIAHPERVSRLVLVDSASEAEARRGLRFGRLVRHLMFLLMPLLVAPGRERAAYRASVHDPALLSPEVLEGYVRPLHMRGHLRALSRQMRDRGLEPPLDAARITQPTLILWGEHDRVVPVATGEALLSSIQGAQLELVRSAAHLPLEEQPESSNASIIRFLNGDQRASAPLRAEIEARP